MAQIVYEDNHLLVVEKLPGEIVQGDKTGDEPLVESLKLYLKEKYNKPGNVFLGVVHRLDRPVAGLVVFAKTSKALSRLCEAFRKGEVHKTYNAWVPKTADCDWTTIDSWLVRNEKQNKSYSYPKEVPNSKHAILKYRTIKQADRYTLLEINLLTGRHHQIRCQLASIGLPIKGDLKYGARRSNPDASISLQAHRIQFIHPVTKESLDFTCSYRRQSESPGQ